MNKGRLEAFSDGVLAVIITIMVLEMKSPNGTSVGQQKRNHRPQGREVMPFFVGVANQSPPTMTISSAEFLPYLFSWFGALARAHHGH